MLDRPDLRTSPPQTDPDATGSRWRQLGADPNPLEPTVFHQTWLLSALTDGAYREAVVMENGKVAGRWPYVIVPMALRRTLCGAPRLAHVLGPAIDDGGGTPANRVARCARITGALLDQMPSTTVSRHKMHARSAELVVLQQRGYDVTVQFTFEVAPHPEAVLWRNLRDKTRNVIRRAQEQLEVREPTDPGSFVATYNANLQSRGLRSYYTDATVIRVCEEAMARRQGRILAAHRADGRCAAAIFIVWDELVTYYLMSTRAPDAGNGAVSLLIWRAMLDAASRGGIFDFDGITSPGSFTLFGGFGGEIAPRYIASRTTMRHRLIDTAARALGRRD